MIASSGLVVVLIVMANSVGSDFRTSSSRTFDLHLHLPEVAAKLLTIGGESHITLRLAKAAGEVFAPNEAVDFIDSLSPEPLLQNQAILGLLSQKRKQVVCCLLNRIPAMTAQTKAIYYYHLTRLEWPEFEELAKIDKGSNITVEIANAPIGRELTLGRFARGYLLMIEVTNANSAISDHNNSHSNPFPAYP